MKNNISVSLKKYIKFVKENSHLDAECNSDIFMEKVAQMESTEMIYDRVRRKYKNVENTILELSKKMQSYDIELNMQFKELESVSESYLVSKTKIRELEKRMVLIISEYYQKISEILDEFGILDVLILRSNNAFERAGVPFFKCDRTIAMNEYKYQNNKNNSLPVMRMKKAVLINKIAKIVDILEYGAMFNKDQYSSKSNSDKRLKYLSKLKTDFLKKTVDDYIVMSNQEQEEFWKDDCEHKTQYEELFGEFFDKLDFFEEFIIVQEYQKRKDEIYELKNEDIKDILGMIVSEKNRVTINEVRDVTRFGLTKDKKGEVVLGMNICGYPMPATLHAQKRLIEDIIAVYTQCYAISKRSYKLQFPKYDSLRVGEDIFATNLLFKPTAEQREKLKIAYFENKNNPLIKFFYEQLNSKETKNADMVDFDEFIK